jgi:hypothetical protein
MYLHMYGKYFLYVQRMKAISEDDPFFVFVRTFLFAGSNFWFEEERTEIPLGQMTASYRHKKRKDRQGDQIGRIFDYRAIVYSGHFL